MGMIDSIGWNQYIAGYISELQAIDDTYNRWLEQKEIDDQQAKDYETEMREYYEDEMRREMYQAEAQARRVREVLAMIEYIRETENV